MLDKWATLDIINLATTCDDLTTFRQGAQILDNHGKIVRKPGVTRPSASSSQVVADYVCELVLDNRCAGFAFKGLEMSKQITLTQGKVAIVSDEDYERLASGFYKWYAIKSRNTYYVQGYTRDNYRTPVLMHRLIMGANKGAVVDHIDGDGLNNCRSNLRLATNSSNIHNSHTAIKSKSGYLGVSYVPRGGRYAARIHFDSKTIHLGRFDTPEEAAKAYNDAAIKYFGEFARLNEIGAR